MIPFLRRGATDVGVVEIDPTAPPTKLEGLPFVLTDNVNSFPQSIVGLILMK